MDPDGDILPKDVIAPMNGMSDVIKRIVDVSKDGNERSRLALNQVRAVQS